MAAPRPGGSATATQLLKFSSLPPSLRPLVRAYLLGYAWAVGPRLATLALRHSGFLRRREANSGPDPRAESFLAGAQGALRVAAELRRFPAFCLTLVGGSTLLHEPFRKLLSLFLSHRPKLLNRLSLWIATFLSGWFSLRLLQSRRSPSYTRKNVVRSASPPGVKAETEHLAGRTLELTLFAAARALDVVVGDLWFRFQKRGSAKGNPSKIGKIVSRVTDPLVFSASCALIMWSFIYTPERLPPAYNHWIKAAAQVDQRLLQALQQCRSGRLQYGVDNREARLLEGMCRDNNWPLEWGNAAKTMPFPCTMVHGGAGPSCEMHAFSRFYSSWKWALRTYLPLNLILCARRPSKARFAQALISASRSSAFLGAFITLFRYGVCLGRTRLGPLVVGEDVAARNRLDGGVCIGAGCALCGWSIFLESASRRKDMALFVAPRAMATVLPRKYSLDKQWRETLVFAASIAVVFTCMHENPRQVRGLVGRTLEMVLQK